MTKDKWIWMPHPGHLCIASQCRFHLNTYVGKYIVSTVGEYVPADSRESDWMKKNGFKEIGLDRTYETMVFKAVKSKDKCCPWRQSTGSNLDMEGYNDADSAAAGHMKTCIKWSKK